MIESGIEPSIEHYGCMVDLLHGAGDVNEVYNFIQTMPFSPNPVIWRTLLIACQKNKMLHRGDSNHLEAKEIRQVLKDISERVGDSGYEPRISDVLHYVVDEEKGIYLCEHGERLAIAYGLLKTKAPAPI
ncbi:hypothetical protein PTKIN_Ptkin13bG0215900 [Pterospermum kingtungense]